MKKHEGQSYNLLELSEAAGAQSAGFDGHVHSCVSVCTTAQPIPHPGRRDPVQLGRSSSWKDPASSDCQN